MGTGELLGKPDKNCGEVTLDGLPSRPGEVEILPATSCYRNRDKLRQLWARLGSKASVVFTRECETGIMVQHLNFQCTLCQVVAYRRLKTRKFETFSSKSGHGRLRGVVACKRFQI